MPTIITGSRIGSVFELDSAYQIMIECSASFSQLANGSQEIILENLGTGQVLSLAGAEIGTGATDRVLASSWIWLSAGVYRWRQEHRWVDSSPPNSISHQFNDPHRISTSQPVEFTCSGTNDIYSIVSRDGVYDMTAQGIINYSLSDGEEIEARLEVVDITAGTPPISTAVTTAEGPDAGTLDTGAIPYTVKDGHLFKTLFSLQTNAASKQKCILKQIG
jgi:hypothetical protein